MNDGLRVLVVDDEVKIRRFLRISLEANGYRVFETDSGQDAIVKTAQLHPDLVVLDLGLPDMDGSEVLRQLHISNQDAGDHSFGARFRSGQGCRTGRRGGRLSHKAV